ncbi:PREDICTED: uncharacterized protein LOC106547872 [Thamnophis sirtalis]|uniref:Uncharacterized protein LOC106547872 n=1 Tax=Thamnophis sirtalis TaxID=35019 RepID=A0A6I9YAL0_9SAUR|nr:PREDICTED: uncharacterized protein LOC106547872 [Thamnophis sirtalis]
MRSRNLSLIPQTHLLSHYSLTGMASMNTFAAFNGTVETWDSYITRFECFLEASDFTELSSSPKKGGLLFEFVWDRNVQHRSDSSSHLSRYTWKKKLENKVKKLEEAAAKHTQEFKQLKAEKKVLEKELKKAQEKIDGFPNRKQKKVLKNAETQSESENLVANVDKEKIKFLLEELWQCIENSTGKKQINKREQAVETRKKISK